MAHFTTAGKHYSDAVELPEFSPLDVTVTPGSGGSSGTSITQTAPRHLNDGAVTYDFLFWDTGRQLTTRHSVRWTFNHADNWATWNAVAWYGIPGGTNGHPNEQFGAYWVGLGPLAATPIDPSASTFVNGPNPGDTAFPGDGSDHEVRTEWGSDTVEALATMQRSASEPVLSFSGIQKIVFGGDPSEAVFDENDNVISTPVTTVFGTVDTTSRTLALVQSDSGLALVGYVVPAPSTRRPVFIDELIALVRDITLIDINSDPSPEDRLRLRLMAEAVDLVAGDTPDQTDAFAGLVDAAAKMNKAELQRTIIGTQATLARGEAALKSIQAIAGQQAKLNG